MHGANRSQMGSRRKHGYLFAWGLEQTFKGIERADSDCHAQGILIVIFLQGWDLEMAGTIADRIRVGHERSRIEADFDSFTVSEGPCMQAR